MSRRQVVVFLDHAVTSALWAMEYFPAGRANSVVRNAAGIEVLTEGLAGERVLEDEDRTGIMMAGHRTMSEVVRHHLRNVEVRHVDLDIAHLDTDWPPDSTALLASLLDRAASPDLSWSIDEHAADIVMLDGDTASRPQPP